jgi:hypothetical protein
MPAPVTRQPNNNQNLTAGQAVVTAQKLRMGEIIKERTKSAPIASSSETEAIQNPSHVTTELSITKNMDNYESMRVGVSISSPCHNDDEPKLVTHEHNMNLAMKMLAKEAALVSSEWF